MEKKLCSVLFVVYQNKRYACTLFRYPSSCIAYKRFLLFRSCFTSQLLFMHFERNRCYLWITKSIFSAAVFFSLSLHIDRFFHIFRYFRLSWINSLCEFIVCAFNAGESLRRAIVFRFKFNSFTEHRTNWLHEMMRVDRYRTRAIV